MSSEPLVAKVEEHLRLWAKKVNEAISPSGIFLFGSLVYKDGLQFDAAISDIDLVVCIPGDLTTAHLRAEWLESLAAQKHLLELDLLQLLKRSNADSPICSVVAATTTEIYADIHKDGAAQFFSNNVFRNLLLDESPDGPLPGAGSFVIDNHLACSALRFAQKYRNLFLATSANRTKRLAAWTGSDPVPKDVMRHAAMAAAARSSQPTPGAEFDVKIGLDFLSEHLYERRDEFKSYYRLHDWVSGRRGGRGCEENVDHLEPEMYLLLAEVIFDLGSDALESDLVPRLELPLLTNGARTPVSNASGAADTLVLPAALPATFAVSERFSLIGSIDELKATIEEATHNLKWRLKPSFRVVFAESVALAAAISCPQPEMKPSERRLLAKNRDRKLLLEHLSSIVERGFRLILYYQNLLLRNGSKQQKDLIIALNSFLRRVEQTQQHSIGGIFEAYVYIETQRQFIVRFSMDAKARDRLLASCGFTDVLELAAKNQPLAKVSQEALARYFVPQLVFDYVAKTELGLMPPIAGVEEIVFDLSRWDVGIC